MYATRAKSPLRTIENITPNSPVASVINDTIRNIPSATINIATISSRIRLPAGFFLGFFPDAATAGAAFLLPEAVFFEAEPDAALFLPEAPVPVPELFLAPDVLFVLLPVLLPGEAADPDLPLFSFFSAIFLLPRILQLNVSYKNSKRFNARRSPYTYRPRRF